MKKVLGIHVGHNSSIALLLDGRLEYAVQEERFTYVKNQWGVPLLALQEAHRRYGLDDLNEIAISGTYIGDFDMSRNALVKHFRSADSFVNIFKQRLKRNSLVFRIFRYLRSSAKHVNMPSYVRSMNLRSFDHHLCHAASAYYGQGNMKDDIAVITCDGSGDGLAGAVYLGRAGRLQLLTSLPEFDSIGNLYTYFTVLFNMMPLEHEYKIMGLAPYCNDKTRVAEFKKALTDLFKWKEHETIWEYCGKYPTVQSAGQEFKRLFNAYRFDVVAAGLQSFTEEMLCDWIRKIIRLTGVRKLALAGGVFMNVRANQLIAELPEVQSCFVFPSCGDETTALGACYLAWFDISGSPPDPLETFYLGDEISELDDFIETLSGPLRTEYVPEIEKKVAELLAAGQIVGRVKGGMEFGARALGNRSILADPSAPGVVRRINDMIKGRDFWMPFAPSVLAEDVGKYFHITEAGFSYEYMMFTAQSMASKRTYACGALHPYDFTGRLHVVTEQNSPDYHNLLIEYKRLTGESLILNTSYNLHGFPIVRTPAHAVDVLLNSGLHYLALGNYLVTKEMSK